jgi:hypothetical protein
MTIERFNCVWKWIPSIDRVYYKRLVHGESTVDRWHQSPCSLRIITPCISLFSISIPKICTFFICVYCYMWPSSSKANFQGTLKNSFSTSSRNLIINEWLKYVQIHVIHTFYLFFAWNWAENHLKYAVKQTHFRVFFFLL